MRMEKKIEVYTDGSCPSNPGNGGWAFVVIHPDIPEMKIAHKGVRSTTNNRMELTAVIEALKSCIINFKDGHKKYPIHIFCDSQYVVKGMNEWRSVWERESRLNKVANYDLWAELILVHTLIFSIVEVKYIHVRGHAGNRLNELADYFAGFAVKELDF